MDNSPDQNGYNIEIQGLERISIMDVRTTKPHSPWENKSESAINIIKLKSKRIIVQRNIPTRVWYFGMV